jgi:hypothetical protein
LLHHPDAGNAAKRFRGFRYYLLHGIFPPQLGFPNQFDDLYYRHTMCHPFTELCGGLADSEAFALDVIAAWYP